MSHNRVLNLLHFFLYIGGTLEDDDYYYNNDGELTSSSSKSSSSKDGTDADIIAYILMMLGWFIIIRALADYFRAKQMEKIICAEPALNATSTSVETIV